MPYVTLVKKESDKKVEQYTVALETQHQQTSVKLDEQTFALNWQQIASLATDEKGKTAIGGRYSLLVEEKSYEVFVRHIPRPDDRESQTYEIQLGGESFEVTVEDERTRILEDLTRSGSGSGISKVQAPMPGLVVNTLVAVGDTVEAEQTVVVLEAMKMENDLATPIAGIVKEVKVNKGETVDQGQVLVTIESEQPSA